MTNIEEALVAHWATILEKDTQREIDDLAVLERYEKMLEQIK